MEIIQEIGSYAGFAAVIGLAVLAALYFSQARDVKRLREWAGRAPERPPVPAAGQRVVAQPMAKPAQPPAGGPMPQPPSGGPAPPPVPRPPGVPAPAQAAATGAAPAVAKGPAPATPAAGAGEPDTDAHGTVVRPPAEPREHDEQEGGEDERALAADAPEPASDAESNGDGTGEIDSYTDEGDALGEDERPETGEWSSEDDRPETGEWSPEDEHSELDFTDEHDVVPATPAAAAAAAPRPPQPPRPFPSRATPGSGAGTARRGPILPPYAESRPAAKQERPASDGRRTVLVAVAAIALLAVIAFGALQVLGGDDSDPSPDAGGVAVEPSTDGDGSGRGPVDPADVTVAVLNGTTVPGLAAQLGDKIVGQGFELGTVTNNFDQERAESVVLFASGAEREAADVSRRLDISQREPVDPDSQALAGDATVVVVAGADQTQ